MSEEIDYEPYFRVIEMVTLLLAASDLGSDVQGPNIVDKKMKIEDKLSPVLDRFIFGRKYKHPKSLPIWERFSDVNPDACPIKLSAEDIENINKSYDYFSRTIKPLFEARDNLDRLIASSITSMTDNLICIRKSENIVRRAKRKG